MKKSRKYWSNGQIPDKSIPEFWKRVDKRSEEECWNWLAYPCRGYGYFYYPSGQSQAAHRVSWYLHNGCIPEGRVLVCHTCDNPKCVNPKHLFLGTHKDNTQDMYAKGRNRYKVLKGEENGNSRLTWPEVREIRRLWNEADNRWGMQSRLSEKFKVDRQVIVGIVKGIRWVE